MIRKLLIGLSMVGTIMTAQAKDFVVDVRTAPEIAQTGKVQGALTDDVQQPTFMDKFDSFNIDPNEDTVLVYCRSGKRAELAKQILQQHGYKNVRNLGGYEDAAKTLNKPLVK